MTHQEDKSRIKIILQLQEARIGDIGRLESIKKSLDEGKPLPETDVQYLEETLAEFQTAVEHQRMCDWAMEFVQKLQEKENGKNTSLDNLKTLIEEEKKTYNIDQKLVERASTQLKHAVEHEKRINWTLELISKLKQSKIGDAGKLNQISKSLKSGKLVNEADRKYLMEKERHFKKVVEYKTKVTWSLDTIKKLQEAQIKHSNKLEKIRNMVEHGNLISENDQSYLNARYEKLQRLVDEQNKIAWTIRTIDKFHKFGVGDSARFDSIRKLLEDEIPVPENEINYLKGQYRMLCQKLKHTRKIELIVGLIDDLQETEIGDSQRLGAIKKSIEEKRPIQESEITYLKDKYKILNILAKNLQGEFKKEKHIRDEVDYNSVLNELNEAIMESERLQSRVSA